MAGQRVELPAYSMFANTPIYDLGSQGIVLGLMQPVVVPSGTDELWNMPGPGVARLDLISNDLYGTPELWWVIASVNDMLDPLVSVPQGTPLRVPTKARLAAEGVLNV